MAHLVSVEPNGNIIRVKVTGLMSMETFEHIVPYLDTAIEEFDSARLLFDLTDYSGREPDAPLEDAEFSLPHWAEVERVAFIGDRKFEPRVPAFCKPFTAATVRYFYSDQDKDVEEWIHEGVE